MKKLKLLLLVLLGFQLCQPPRAEASVKTFSQKVGLVAVSASTFLLRVGLYYASTKLCKTGEHCECIAAKIDDWLLKKSNEVLDAEIKEEKEKIKEVVEVGDS